MAIAMLHKKPRNANSNSAKNPRRGQSWADIVEGLKKSQKISRTSPWSFMRIYTPFIGTFVTN